MARLTRARIVSSARGEPLFRAAPPEHAVRRLAREELEARERAAQVLGDAERRAAAIVESARKAAAGVADAAAKEAAANEQAKLAALFVALRAREAHTDEASLDRAVELARVLAERLVGEALAVDRATIARLARQALLEARGARSVRIEAHPDDVAALEEHLSILGTAHVAAVTADATMQRGCLRLRTDLGTLDANLSPQLDRLAAALRDALR